MKALEPIVFAKTYTVILALMGNIRGSIFLRNLLEDEKGQIYEKHVFSREPSYLNLLMVLAKGGKFPGLLLRFFLAPPFVVLFTSKPIKPLIRLIYIFLKNIHGKYLAPKRPWAVGA